MQAAGQAESQEVFCVGDQIEGRYANGRWYPASVEHVNGDGTVTLKWLDGDTADLVKRPKDLRCLVGPWSYQDEQGRRASFRIWDIHGHPGRLRYQGEEQPGEKTELGFDGDCAYGSTPRRFIRMRPTGREKLWLSFRNAEYEEWSGDVVATKQPFDVARYADAESIFDALAKTVRGLHPVRLLRMSWLLGLRGGVLRRRQELPEEAFVSADELRSVWEEGGRGGLNGVLPVVAISCCWDSREHPDPKGIQLDRVISVLEQESPKFGTPELPFKGFKEMAIFWDWGSLLQGEPEKSRAARRAAWAAGKSEEEAEEAAWEAGRTFAERAAFDHAKHRTMDLWYAHQGTTVLLLTQHPKERGSIRLTGHEDSGWTTYERCSADQKRRTYRSDAKWHVVLDVRGAYGGAEAAGRRWPVGAADFDALVDEAAFTNEADRETVKCLFRRMSTSVLRGAAQLDFGGMPPPTAEEASRLGGCLALCKSLKMLQLQGCMGECLLVVLCQQLTAGAMSGLQLLNVGGNCIGDAGAEALAQAAALEGTLTFLKKLFLHRNQLGDSGAEALARAAVRGSFSRVEELHLHENQIGDSGAKAVARSFARLQQLCLHHNHIGDAGAAALARAAAQGFLHLEELHLHQNQIGDSGAKALAQQMSAGKLLRTAVLDGNRIGRAGMSALAAAGHPSHLRKNQRADQPDELSVAGVPVEQQQQQQPQQPHQPHQPHQQQPGRQQEDESPQSTQLPDPHERPTAERSSRRAQLPDSCCSVS